jgi:hypothetical protein
MNQPQYLQGENPKATKVQLESELADFKFNDTMAKQVLVAAKHKSSIWEQEIVIPVPAAALVLLLIIGGAVWPAFLTSHPNSHKVIVTETGVFDQNLLARGTGQ